jgi:hypothetical protein
MTYAEIAAENFDKRLARMVYRDGGTYDSHMHRCVGMFFSDNNIAVELRFTYKGNEYAFTGKVWSDNQVEDRTKNEIFQLYGSVNRMKSMLQNRSFESLNKWGAACQNGLGADIVSMNLAGHLFADGVRYEDLIQAAQAARLDAGVEVSDMSSSDEDVSSDEDE